jgi:hypothetical protein
MSLFYLSFYHGWIMADRKRLFAATSFTSLKYCRLPPAILPPIQVYYFHSAAWRCATYIFYSPSEQVAKNRQSTERALLRLAEVIRFLRVVYEMLNCFTIAYARYSPSIT